MLGITARSLSGSIKQLRGDSIRSFAAMNGKIKVANPVVDLDGEEELIFDFSCAQTRGLVSVSIFFILDPFLIP